MIHHGRLTHIFLFSFLILCIFLFLSNTNEVKAGCTITCTKNIACSGLAGSGINTGGGNTNCTTCKTTCWAEPTPSGCHIICPGNMQCYQPPMPPCPPGFACAQVMPNQICVTPASNSAPAPTMSPLPTSSVFTPPVPTSIPVLCGLNRPCPIGQECYQPVRNCPAGTACPAVVIDPYCVTNTPTPLACLKAKGDANCDGMVNRTDFDIFAGFIRGQGYTNSAYSADFNADGKVNLVDYEIWRNTFYH